MQVVEVAIDDLTGPTEKLTAMSISKTSGIILEDGDNENTYKAIIARLNRESEMYFTQKKINGKLFIRRVA
jgi:hypothetical protein